MSFYNFGTNNYYPVSGFNGFPFDLDEFYTTTQSFMGESPFLWGFTFAELVKLFWRVKKVRIQASVSNSFGTRSVDYTFTVRRYFHQIGSSDSIVAFTTETQLYTDIPQSWSFYYEGGSSSFTHSELDSTFWWNGNTILKVASTGLYWPYIDFGFYGYIFTGSAYQQEFVSLSNFPGNPVVGTANYFGKTKNIYRYYTTTTAASVTFSIAEYWPWDPGDGDGPVYNSTTGAQLRDPLAVAQSNGLLYIP